MEVGIDMGSVFPEEMSEDVCVNTGAAKEDACKGSMNSSIYVLIKVANQRERDANGKSNPDADVIPSLVCSSIIKVLIGCSDVYLHASKRENCCHNAPYSVVER